MIYTCIVIRSMTGLKQFKKSNTRLSSELSPGARYPQKDFDELFDVYII